MTAWERIWPKELLVYQSNPKAIPLASGPYPQLCPNCGGHRMMMVYVIDGGPYKSPDGRVKWLDLPPDPPNPQTPSVSGWYSGRLEVAPCPVCAGGQMDEYLRRNCGLSGDDLEISLSDFRTNGNLSGKAKALSVAQSLLAMNQQTRGFVTYIGGYGVGKTHLLKAIVNGFRKIRVMARYSTMADLLADVRERFGDDHGVRAVEDAIAEINRYRVLCLDEIDRVNLTGWAKETIFRLINYRYENQHQVLTVIATNMRIEDMPPEFGYLASRLRSGVVVEVPGPDMRPAQGLKVTKELADNAKQSGV
jgi:DNA replication protein DnaC